MSDRALCSNTFADSFIADPLSVCTLLVWPLKLDPLKLMFEVCVEKSRLAWLNGPLDELSVLIVLIQVGEVIPFNVWGELNPSYIVLLNGVTVLPVAGERHVLLLCVLPVTGVIGVDGVPLSGAPPPVSVSVLVAGEVVEERWVNEDGIRCELVFVKEGERQEVVVSDEDELEIADEILEENGDAEVNVDRLLLEEG